MLKILYCGDCHDSLCKYGEVATDLFMHICESFLVSKKPMEIQTNVHELQHGVMEIIQFLEMKYYVVSTEIENETLLVKPLGIQCLQKEENHVFHVCFNRGKHG